jgi:O-antigen/teichoic acid export membrane protein
MLRKMAINIGSVSFIFGVITLSASLSSILLARLLTQGDFGEFVHMRYLILFLPSIFIWGQEVAVARYFSIYDIRRFQWHHAFLKIIFISVILTVIGVYISDLIYHLEKYKIILLFISTVFSCANLFYANLLRSQGRYDMAIFMENGSRGVYFILLLLIYFSAHITKVHAIYSYVIVIALTSIYCGWYTYRTVPCGTQKVPNEMHTTGLLLMGIDTSVTIMTSIDGLFIKGILGNEALGLYGAALVPGQIFRVLKRSAKFVWIPEFGRSKNVRFKLINIGVAIVAISLFALLFFAAYPILNLLYSGKYNDGVFLLRIFALVGVFQLFYALASSLIMGKLGKIAIQWHLSLSVVSLIIYAITLYYMLKIFGVNGAGWALLLLSILRTIAAYFVVYKFRNTAKVNTATDSSAIVFD